VYYPTGLRSVSYRDAARRIHEPVAVLRFLSVNVSGCLIKQQEYQLSVERYTGPNLRASIRSGSVRIPRYGQEHRIMGEFLPKTRVPRCIRRVQPEGTNSMPNAHTKKLTNMLVLCV